MKLLGLNREEVKRVFKEGKVTIAVYGLGKMGLPLAAVFADHGANVIGVDINNNVVEAINNGTNHINEEPGLSELVEKNVKAGRLKATTDGVWAAKQADVMIILVPTLTDDRGNLKLDPVYDVAKKISKGLEKGDIVITEATMPPGTTESLIPILEESGLKLGEFGLAHAPERTMTGTAIRDITGQYPKIVGASDEKTLEAVIGIYETINKKGVIPMSSIKAAEAVKVFEGVYRDVNIALANELALWCEEHSLDALEVFRAANTQPYCHLHMPGAGVGGHCIPVYPWFVINLAKKTNPRLIKTAREINDSMPHHIVELTIKALNEIGKPLKGSNILVLGLTFRGGVKEFMKAAAKPIIEELKEWGAKVYAYDPLCTPKDAERFGAEWKGDFKDVDAIIITTDHREFKALDLGKIAKQVRNKVIIDGRNVLNVEKAKELGFIYLRVGKG
ncbi:nucleotide sugar dehydrogenase [Thermococcus argininiproducens]|uniref:UDP-N-acetyl-D-mannosamine dehydrogenase n=1 Tax=Thermococcus argininiproducens TaxID=2866384 RepID=A0A9E7MBP2_9EURY|nr:nucleotide sugar dehydrogenase [Thermococcus argininiproducens]USH00455.1 nucleotide sugar dehydrogenase [Thermococcus argininiproducens]